MCVKQPSDEACLPVILNSWGEADNGMRRHGQVAAAVLPPRRGPPGLLSGPAAGFRAAGRTRMLFAALRRQKALRPGEGAAAGSTMHERAGALDTPSDALPSTPVALTKAPADPASAASQRRRAPSPALPTPASELPPPFVQRSGSQLRHCNDGACPAQASRVPLPPPPAAPCRQDVCEPCLNACGASRCYSTAIACRQASHARRHPAAGGTAAAEPAGAGSGGNHPVCQPVRRAGGGCFHLHPPCGRGHSAAG